MGNLLASPPAQPVYNIETDVHVIPELEVTAVGATLLAAVAITWNIPARTALSR